MWKQITGTFLSKIAIALSNLATVVLLSQVLGEEGRGKCALYVVIVALALVINEFLTGATAGLILKKYPSKEIIKVNYTWFIIPSILIPLLFNLFQTLNWLEILGLIAACWLNAAQTLNLHLFLGRGRLLLFNFMSFLSPFLSLLVCTLLFQLNALTPVNFLFTLCLCWFACWLIGFFLVWRFFIGAENGQEMQGGILRFSFKMAYRNQIATIAGITNIRLIYFFMDSLKLGIYANAQSLSEATLMVPGSLGQLLYSKILTTDDAESAKVLLKRFVHINCILYLLGIALVFAIPGAFYQWLFGPDFNGVKPYLQLFIIGSFAHSLFLILTYWFTGNRLFNLNVMGNVLALIINLLCTFAFLALGTYGIKNAIIALVVSQIISAIYMVVIFLRKK